MDEIPRIDFTGHRHRIAQINPIQVSGKVTEIVGLIVEAKGPKATLGEVCQIASSDDMSMPSLSASRREAS
jgi:flagellum-specific ATP synthase